MCWISEYNNAGLSVFTHNIQEIFSAILLTFRIQILLSAILGEIQPQFSFAKHFPNVTNFSLVSTFWVKLIESAKFLHELPSYAGQPNKSIAVRRRKLVFRQMLSHNRHNHTSLLVCETMDALEVVFPFVGRINRGANLLVFLGDDNLSF